MERTCLKNPENPRYVDLFLTNRVQRFQNTSVFATGISDFDKIILNVLETSFPKSAPKKLSTEIIKVLTRTLKNVQSYESFENKFLNALQRHAPLKTKVVRANRAPYLNRTLREAIMKKSELKRKYLKNRTNENRIRYKRQKNFCSKLYKKERKKFYSNIEWKHFKDNKKFWRTVKLLINDIGVQSSKITLVDKKEEHKTAKNKIRDNSNEIISDDLDVANTLNKCFQNPITKLGITEYSDNFGINTTALATLEDPVDKLKN